MPTFADNLRRERESRNKSIEEVAEATEIGLAYLEALERGEIDALPGPNFGKLYIRAYAGVLDFDPQPLIDAYEQEHSKRFEAESAAEPPPDEANGPETEAAPLGKAEQKARDRAKQEERLRARQERARARLADGEATAGEARDAARAGESRPTEDTKALRERLARARRELNRARPMPEAPDEPEESAPKEEVATELPEEVAAAVVETQAVEPATLGGAPEPRAARTGVGTGRVVALLVGAALLIVIAWMLFGLLREGSSDPAPTLKTPPELVVYRDSAGTPPATAPPDRVEESDAAIAAPEPARVEDSDAAIAAPEPTRVEESDPAPAAPEPARETPPAAADLAVSEFGLGRGVVDRRLVDPTDRFPEGDVAWFLTRVLGGAPGTTIRHVWLREGRQVQSIELRLGGSRWRTHSRKTLWGTGDWAVEARDAVGRVLARKTFTCVKAGT